MNYFEHNRRAWNRESLAGVVWSRPVSSEVVAKARTGHWSVILTPKLAVPKSWFGKIQGKQILCLASGGGQQAPVLAAAGGRVISFDLSDEQLAKDRLVASREGLDVQTVQGDMADLSPFADESFDLIFHPAANVFVPDVACVWRECHRVLRPGGVLLAGFMNPVVFLFDHEEADNSGKLTVKYALPYSDLKDLSSAVLEHKLAREEPLEFSHSLDVQLGGQLAAGLLISGFYEDRWFDDSWPLSNYCPIAMATRSVKRA